MQIKIIAVPYFSTTKECLPAWKYRIARWLEIPVQEKYRIKAEIIYTPAGTLSEGMMLISGKGQGTYIVTGVRLTKYEELPETASVETLVPIPKYAVNDDIAAGNILTWVASAARK